MVFIKNASRSGGFTVPDSILDPIRTRVASGEVTAQKALRELNNQWQTRIQTEGGSEKLQNELGLSQNDFMSILSQLDEIGREWDTVNALTSYVSGTLDPNTYYAPGSLQSSSSTTTNQTPSTQTSQSVNSTNSNTPVYSSTGRTFPTTNLQPGDSGESVRQLQDYLVNSGYMTQEQVNTGYGTYGPQTTTAVRTLQSDLGVDNSTGPGYWGPRTIQAINNTLGSTSQPTPDSAINNIQTLGNQIGTGLQNLADKGYGNIDISELPQDIDINQFPNTTLLPSGGQGDLLTELDSYLQQQVANGQILNPNIELTPEKVAEFLSQAESEINPYYQGQIKLARESLLSSIGYSSDQVLQEEQRLEQKYGRSLRGVGESAAEQGFALSGKRMEQEKDLATQTQQQIDDTRKQLAFNAANSARTFAQSYGSSELPNFDIGATPSVRAGSSLFSRSGQSQPLYQLSPDVYQGLIGSEEFNRRGAVASRASGLEEAFRTGQSINNYRTLSV